jgi:DNA-binding response OmpR family regulator
MGRAGASRQNKRILIVDDEYAICDTVCAILTDAGFEADSARTLAQARLLMEQRDYALLLLDIILVGESGLQLLTWLREERKRQTPVVLLSGIAREDTKVKAFEAGADDYIVKPFFPRELVARVKAILRRSGSGGVIRFGPYRLDLEARQVYRGTERVALRPKELALLEALCSHPGTALTREELLSEAWGPNSDTDIRAVAVAVHNLRQQLEEDPRNPRYICTVAKYGYRMEGIGQGE